MILVCGSRSWVDASKIWGALMIFEPTTVIHGGARGADILAAQIAADLGHDVRPAFKPDWKKHGKRAGFVRNLEMLDCAPNLVLAFWDGESAGTRHTITQARKRGIPVQVVFDDQPRSQEKVLQLLASTDRGRWYGA